MKTGKSAEHPPVAALCLYFRHFRGCRCGGRHAGSTCSGGARRDGGSRKCRGSSLGKAETPVIPGEKRELLRTPTLFELQGGDERVPVIAPAVIRKILPEKEY